MLEAAISAFLVDFDGGAGGEGGELDAEGVAEEFEPAVVVSLAEITEDGVVDGNDDFGFDVFDVFGGVGNFGPRGRNRNTDGSRVLNRRAIKRIAGVGKEVIYNYTEVVARDLVLQNRGVGLTKELEFEAAYFPSLATFNDDGATD